MARRSGNAALASTFRHRSLSRAVTGVKGSTGPVQPPVAGFIAWWDAPQITGVADGATLSTWPDASGGGHDLASKATAPTYWKTTAAHLVNGLPTVALSSSSLLCTLTQAQPWSVVAVFKSTSTSGIHTLLCSNGQNALLWVQPGGYQLVASTVLTTAATQDTALHSMLGVANGASSKAQYDTTVATGNAGTVGLSGATNMGAVDNAGTDPWAGLVCEMIVWPLALSAAQITSVRAYLTTKWGTP